MTSPFTWNHSTRVLLTCADGETRVFRRHYVYDAGRLVGTWTEREYDDER